MRKKILKTGVAHLLSLGVLLTSSVPAAQEGIVQNIPETFMQEEAELQTESLDELQTELLSSALQSEVSQTQSEESLPEEVPAQENETSQESIPSSEDSLITDQTQSEVQTGVADETTGQSEQISESQIELMIETQSEELQQEVETEMESVAGPEMETEESEEETHETGDIQGTEEFFYEKAVLSADAQIYAGWKSGSSVLTTLPAGYSVYVTAVVVVDDEPKWAHIIFDVNGYSSEGYILFELLQINAAVSLMDIDDTQEFPQDYQEALNELRQAHPNWIFKPVYVGDTFSYAVDQQMSVASRALISMSYNECFRSLLDRDYNWQTNTWTQWEPNWTGASEETVRYYMDPRNFLNENDIFMFESLTYESYQTETAVEAALANEFMSNAKVPGEDYTYAWLFCWIGEKYNINPVALASRVRQEQGSGKSDMISGEYPGYEGLYNYFNIEANGSTTDEIIQNGLKEAKTGSTIMLPDGTVSTGAWDTPAKALIGGALKFANQYILQNQNTLYAQKFDYDGQYNGKYWHQYMTNITAPYSEGNQVRRSYSSTGQLNNSFVFLIPVYEERPASSPKPTERPNMNNCINSLTVNDQEVIETFNKDQRDFYYYVGEATIYANVKVKASASASTVSFSNIGSLSHKVEVCNITVTAEDGTAAEYRLIIGRGVEIEDGFFDGFDVESYRKRYPQLNKEYGDDIDAYYEHYLLTGKSEGWDGSKDGPFPDDSNDNSNNDASTRPAAVYNGVDYASVFDAEYYLNKYSDLKAAFGNDSEAALKHFVVYGIKEGRQGCAEFNIDVYQSNYADLKKAFGDDNSAYVSHYLEYGLKEGRNARDLIENNDDDKNDNNTDDKDNSKPEVSDEEKKYSAVYDYTYYKNAYADLRAAFGDDSAKYFEHFLQCGMAEGRQASADFDVKIYKENYADLRKAFGNNNVLYYNHYIEHGKAEGRTASAGSADTDDNNNNNGGDNNTGSLPSAVYNGIDYSLVYDYEYYRKKYSDLRAAFGDDPEKYLKHFVENGMREGRQANASFNLSAYKNRYADLRNAFGSNNVSYYMHYINNGKSEGRNAAN